MYNTQPLQAFKVLSPLTDYRFFRKADCIKFFAGSTVLATVTQYQNVNKIQSGGPMCLKTVTTERVSLVQVVKLITQLDNCQYQLIQVDTFNSDANFDSIIWFLPEIVENQQFLRSFLSLEMTMKYRWQKLCKIYFASF